MKRAAFTVLFAFLSANSFAQVRDITGEPLPPIGENQAGFAGGTFPGLTLPNDLPGGHIQRAWDKAAPGSGVMMVAYEPTETVRASLRQRMIATITIPSNDSIIDWALADQTNFSARRVMETETSPSPTKLWVWVVNPGYDTNLNVIGRSGEVYTFYLRGETWNSDNTTVAKIVLTAGNPLINNPTLKTTAAGATLAAPPHTADQQRSVTALAAVLPDIPPEYLKKGCQFDPTQIRHDRHMTGDKSIAPVWVYRDSCFTYLDWGANHDGKKWPPLWQIEHGVDKPVNYDVSRDGRFMVVYTTNPITLAIADKIACIRPDPQAN